MKQDELDAIRARCEATTPGPWGQHRRRVAGLYIENMVLREDEISICRDLCVEDAAFIAHAREDVPALLDEVERLHAERKMLWRQVSATEGTVMTYAAVHVVRWRPEFGEPACGFIQADREDGDA